MEVNIGYVWGQLLDAERQAAGDGDDGVRARAAAKAERWRQVLAGMRDGSVVVGSRTPTAAPAWVTLEVAAGGFATGRYAAGGALADWETELAHRLGVPATRLALNLAHLHGARAGELLDSGAYRVDVPEEGALLVVAWLRAQGHDGSAPLVAVLAPWMGELRFYPRPADGPLPDRRGVRRQDLGVTVDAIDVPRRQPRLDTMRAALTVWTPLGDRAMALVLDTVDGEAPRLAGAEVVGGAIGVRRPPDWDDRVAELARDVGRAGEATTRRARAVTRLVARLTRCAAGADRLAGDARLRRALATYLARHGVPGTTGHRERRAADARAVAAPRHTDLRRVLVARLRALPRDGGVDLDAASRPVDDREAHDLAVPAGAPMPTYLAAKVARSWEAPLDVLVERGVIPSSEELARVVPQVTAEVRAGAIAEPRARALYRALYLAFRRRRGLLLLAYQHQVRIHELPWVTALATRAGGGVADEAAVVLGQVGAAAVRGFPHTILPNKLVTELSALAYTGGARLPLVEELAADIFMGSFTSKYAEAAQLAARMLAGTLYARYYAIDTVQVARLPTGERRSDELAALCRRRAAALGGARGGVAGNGTIIEQGQILTTHNLALVLAQPGVRAALAPELRRLAERAFTWMVRQLRLPGTGHQLLIRLKNSAYAWRQVVFFLSLVDDGAGFAAWARARLAGADPALAARLEPVVRGLELASAGVRSDERAFAAGGGRVFTGWSVGRHWLWP